MSKDARFALKELVSVEATTYISPATRNGYTFVRGQWTRVTDEKDIDWFRAHPEDFVEKGAVPARKDSYSRDLERLESAGLDKENASDLLNKYKTFMGVKEGVTLKELIDLPRIGRVTAPRIMRALNQEAKKGGK